MSKFVNLYMLEMVLADLIWQAVPTPVAESDADTILSDVEAFQPTIIDALKEIVIKKPIFDGLPLGGVSALVKQDLATLNTSTSAFEAALIAAAPVCISLIIIDLDNTEYPLQ